MVSPDIIEKVAKLARLKLSKDELEEFTKDANEVLEAFEVLAKAPVDGIDDTPPLLPVTIDVIPRVDDEQEVFCTPQAIEQSEHKQEKYFKGPKAF